MAISAILTETSHSSQPQDVGPARSPGHSIRDRSAKQRALPIDKPARPFVSRCFEVKLPCVSKMVYISLAHRCKVWTEGDTGTTGRIGRSRIAADAGLTLTTLKVHLSILVSAGLISIKRTGRTNDYTVRVPSLALKDSNRSTTANLTGHQSHVSFHEPWKAAGVSRATWYRDRARTGPKQGDGRPRIYASDAERLRAWRETKRETDGQAHGPSDGQAHGPSTEGGSQGVQRTKRNARASCSTCTRTWPASYGAECYHCANQPQPPQRESSAPRPNWNPDGYRGTRIRNCPQCHSLERGFEDRCQSCDWTRAAWEARATRGQTE